MPLPPESVRLDTRPSIDAQCDAKAKVAPSGKTSKNFEHGHQNSEKSNDSCSAKSSPCQADPGKPKLETRARKHKPGRQCPEQDRGKTLAGASDAGQNETGRTSAVEDDDRRGNDSDDKTAIKPRLRSTILLVQKPSDPVHSDSTELTPPS